MYQFPFYPDHIPEELKLGRRWVVCDTAKVPYVALAEGERKASSTDPRTWRSYPEAISAFETERYAGIGRVIVEDEGYVGVDLDSCREATTGRMSPKARGILQTLASYSEVSPSQTGVKTWIKADLSMAFVKAGLEIYPRGRYFTTTGQFLPQFPLSIEERTEELAEIIHQEFPKPKKAARPYARGGSVGLDLDETIADSGIEVLAVVVDGTAQTKYRVLCPWVGEHTNNPETGTYMGQYESGALFFKCHHAHCAHRQWQDFKKEHYFPWWIKVVKKDG